MANPYRHPVTNAFISKKEYQAIMAERPQPQPAPERYPPPGPVLTLAEWAERYPDKAAEMQRCDPQLPLAGTPYGHYLHLKKQEAKGVPIRQADEPRIEVTRDQTDRDIQRRIAGLKNLEGFDQRRALEMLDQIDPDAHNKFAADEGEVEEWESPDPIEDLITEHSDRTKYAHRLLSSKHIERFGLRKWDPIKDKDGNSVTYGAEGVLARMPIDMAKARDRHFQRKAENELATVQDILTEDQARENAARDANASSAGTANFGNLRGGDVVRDYQTGESRPMGFGISGGPLANKG